MRRGMNSLRSFVCATLGASAMLVWPVSARAAIDLNPLFFPQSASSNTNANSASSDYNQNSQPRKSGEGNTAAYGNYANQPRSQTYAQRSGLPNQTNATTNSPPNLTTQSGDAPPSPPQNLRSRIVQPSGPRQATFNQSNYGQTSAPAKNQMPGYQQSPRLAANQGYGGSMNSVMVGTSGSGQSPSNSNRQFKRHIFRL